MAIYAYQTKYYAILSKLCDKDSHNVLRIPKANNHGGTIILLPARFIRYIHTINGLSFWYGLIDVLGWLV